ncbi:MAG: nuclear transport factor 2 family protein [Deltaproteobacteria bacterium]|nr:nuclear transport factor 2 family protein [Deltaproteobacteria bacterium]
MSRTITGLHLSASRSVLVNDGFRYVREIRGERDAVLELVAVVDGIAIDGVDLIRWDDAGEITDFKVMVRPRRAVALVRQKVAEMLKLLG